MRGWIVAVVLVGCGGGDGECVLEPGLYVSSTVELSGSCGLDGTEDDEAISLPPDSLPIIQVGCPVGSFFDEDTCSFVWSEECSDGTRLEGHTERTSRTSAESTVNYSDPGCSSVYAIFWTKL